MLIIEWKKNKNKKWWIYTNFKKKFISIKKGNQKNKIVFHLKKELNKLRRDIKLNNKFNSQEFVLINNISEYFNLYIKIIYINFVS